MSSVISCDRQRKREDFSDQKTIETKLSSKNHVEGGCFAFAEHQEPVTCSLRHTLTSKRYHASAVFIWARATTMSKSWLSLQVGMYYITHPK